MDVSSSIIWSEPANWQLMKDFVDRIMQAFPISPTQTRVAIVQFSDSASVEFLLNRYTNNRDVSRAIQAMRHTGGETNIAAALQVTREVVFTSSKEDRCGIKNIAIMITDGAANRDANQVGPETRLAKQADIEIFAIGITNDVNAAQLNSIASDPDRTHVFRASNFSRLTGILSDVIQRSCEVVPTLPPPGVSTPRPTPGPPTPAPVTPSQGPPGGTHPYFCTPAGKMKLEFLENPSSTLLGYSRISNLFQAHFWDFLEIASWYWPDSARIQTSKFGLGRNSLNFK